ERGGYPVLRKPLRQGMFRITAYAERLLAGLDEVDWPQATRTQQAEWIGRSEGAEVDFQVVMGSPSVPGGRDGDGSTASRGVSVASGSSPPRDGGATQFLRVFTTRPDTIFGATYMVVAPEHPIIDDVLTSPRQ